jgi:hypothetical protein
MEPLKEYFVPFLISNIVFGLTIAGALKRPMYARVFLAGFFLWASYINTSIAILSPQTYLTYGRLDALPFYRDFINGFFSHHITLFVCTIALGQFLVFFGLVLNKSWTRLACVGGIIFGLAIAPLGVGSAFPSTVSMAIAFYILLKNYQHDFIWHWKQYQKQTAKKIVLYHRHV